MRIRAASHGFTLIELLVVLVLVGILAVVGIPTYFSVITNNRMAAEMNAFVGELQLARSEAIKQGANASICAADPAANAPTASNPQCLGAGTTNWSQGWVVYVGAPATTQVLRVHVALQGGDTLFSNGGGEITFNRQGFTTQAQTLTLNDKNGTVALRRCAIINTVGRVRLDSGAGCP
ncbi:GspH/FimT family pseudopilin [Acidihalobacter ferrooxydans]|uniref:Type II secretion system protein H n=1 Tax=Acidihalobacter ferrooxydans TaxID=1765967 RepID=A0A1P8UJT3_9GAMM|nr:GspH/FimT family protein [Acidihalobacter ferrooxydans]APZ44108.1 hypothetical protein BW247_14225 [Acidihalobacter ferrooxydans]